MYDVDPITSTFLASTEGARNDAQRQPFAGVVHEVLTTTFELDSDHIRETSDKETAAAVVQYEAAVAARNESIGQVNCRFLEDCGNSLAFGLRSAYPGSEGTTLARFSAAQVLFRNPEHWLAHRAHTVFVEPPPHSDIGVQNHCHETYGSWRILDRTTRRPLPIWIVGEHQTARIAHNYLGLVPRSHTTTQETWQEKSLRFQNRTEGNAPDFCVVRITTKHPLGAPNPAPTPNEIRTAYSPTTKLFTATQFWPEGIQDRVPKADKFELTSRVSDEEIELFDVARGLSILMGEFGQLPLLDRAINNLRVARDAIPAIV